MEEKIFNLINTFYGNDDFCEENFEDFKSLAAYLAKHLEEEA